jgi:hypothetical protein
MELPTHAISDSRRVRRKPEYVPDDPLSTAAEAAAERGQAISTSWRDVRAGRVPPAYRVSPRCPAGADRNCAKRWKPPVPTSHRSIAA